MQTRERFNAADLLRRSASRGEASSAVQTVPAVEPAAMQQAIDRLSPPRDNRRNLLTLVEDFGAVRQRARHDANLRREAQEHEARLRLKALAIQAARIEAELDVYCNEQHAVLNANLLASLGEMLRTMEAVRRRVDLAMIDDRFSFLQMYADAHAQGKLTDDQLEASIDSVSAAFVQNAERMAAEASRCIDDASRLLRSART